MLWPMTGTDLVVTARARLSDEERLDWLRLTRSENVGPRTFRALLEHFGSARAALDALPDLARRGGAARPTRVCSRAEAEREFAAGQALGLVMIGLTEPDYPAPLAAIADPPPLLAVRGKAAALARPAVALVGSRSAWRARSARPGTSSSRAWRAASMQPPIAAACRPAPSRCWPAATTMSFPRITWIC